MKRGLKFLTAVFLICVLVSLPIFAARSATNVITIDENTEDGFEVDEFGFQVSAKTIGDSSTLSTQEISAVNEALASDEGMMKVLYQTRILTDTNEKLAKDYKVLGTMDLFLEDLQSGQAIDSESFDHWPLTVSLSVNGLKEGDPAYLLHFTNGAWEDVTSGVYDGRITGKFYSFSPVMVILKSKKSSTGTGQTVSDVTQKQKEKLSAGKEDESSTKVTQDNASTEVESSSSNGITQVKKSPKTGDIYHPVRNMIGFGAIVLLFLLSGSMLMTKKKR